MKKSIVFILSLVTVLVLFASCKSVEPKEAWESGDSSSKAAKELAKAKTLALLGFNTTLGVEDSALDDFMKEGLSLSNISLTVEMEGDVRFPIDRERLNAHEAQLVQALAESKFAFVDKQKLFASAAYKKFNDFYAVGSTDKNAKEADLRAQAYASQLEILSADGYNATYDQKKREVFEMLTAPSAGALQEVGADLGLIVVEKPFIETKTYGMIPHQLFMGKKPYSTMAVRTYYYIVKKGALGTSVVGYKVVYNDSKQNLQKTYTTKQRKADEAKYLETYDTLAVKNNAEFIKWLNSNAK